MEEMKSMMLSERSKDYNVVISNSLVKESQSMTREQAVLIRTIIMQIDTLHDADLSTYTCRASDLANFLDIESQHLYKYKKNDFASGLAMFCDQLLKVTVGLPMKGKGFDRVQWLSRCRYDEESGQITFRLNSEIKPYVLNLQKFFTEYPLRCILGFRSFYAVRMFEILTADFNADQNPQSVYKYTYSIAELREMLDCKNKYKQTRDFLKRAIYPAVEEINEENSVDFMVSVTVDSDGYKVQSVTFSLDMIARMKARNGEQNNE